MRLHLPSTVLTITMSVFPVSQAADPSDAFPLVTRRVQGWVDRGYYKGCSVWIAQGDRVLYQKSIGDHSPHAEIYIASAGKWLGAAAMLAVVDEGKLSLDDPVSKWLPEFAGDPKGRATVRQLFSHTSGYFPYQPQDNPPDNYQTIAESVAHLLPLPQRCAPGERFEYGGLAMQVAGRIVEVVTGQTWEEAFQQCIAGPLGMTRTRFTPVDPGHIPVIGGGAVSTLSDYARFITMIADGGVYQGRRVLSEKSVDEMLSDQVRGAIVQREELVERFRGHTHNGVYGLGMWREELDQANRATIISSPSWAGTYPWIDRTHDIRGVLIGHVDTSVAGKAKFSGFWTSPVLTNLVRAQLAWDMPSSLANYEQGVAPAQGADLAYEAAGAGEPVILLHGHSFDRRMWDPQFAALARHHRVIRYDLRGYGLSDKPVEGRNFRHADDLAALMDALKIKKAHVIGLSLGGFVVGDFIALHPDRILSATISAGSVYTGPGSHELTGDALIERLAAVEQTRKQGIKELKSRWTEGLLQGCGHHANRLRGPLTEMIREWSAWQPLHVEPPHLLGRRAIELIRHGKPAFPVLWIAGANDRYEKSVEEYKAVLPQMKLVVLEDAGHLSSLEQPDAFTDAVLRQTRGDVPRPATMPAD